MWDPPRAGVEPASPTLQLLTSAGLEPMLCNKRNTRSVTESRLSLLAPQQANGSEKLGMEARKSLYLGSQLTKRMAA